MTGKSGITQAGHHSQDETVIYVRDQHELQLQQDDCLLTDSVTVLYISNIKLLNRKHLWLIVSFISQGAIASLMNALQIMLEEG